MKSIASKIAITIMTVCLLSACAGQQQGQNKRPMQTEQRSNQEDQIIPLESHPETDQIYTQTEFIMPIKEQWYVFWGGTNEQDNYHYAYESQRYAFDLVIKKKGENYEGDKDENQSYYAFGQEVVAPAGGTVIEVESEVRDNEPVGEMNRGEPFGNYVMIDHGNGEYSVIAHMKYQSPVVKAGDEVKQGELIGLCGNSGNSSEPHIHFHVSDSPQLNQGNSIRIKLRNNENPVRGEYVHPSPI